MKQEKLVTHKRSRMKVSESHSGLRAWKQKLLFFLKKSALLKQIKMILNLKLIHQIYNSIKKIKYNSSSLSMATAASQLHHRGISMDTAPSA